ncbi:MAG: hypothetical protein QOG85_213 [Gaiellaceae bacterium]|jgi:hypothetical protein|nr:hypothetical protein [Gaiellaceae bacterium]
MAGNEIMTTGTLHGLKRQIGKIGGEFIGFAITTHELALWDEFVKNAEQSVEIVIRPAQKSLDLEKGKENGKGDPGVETAARGVGKGSKAASGSHQAQD